MLSKEVMDEEGRRAEADPDLTSAQDDIELLDSGPVTGLTRQIALEELYTISTQSQNPEARRLAEQRLDADDITQEEYVAAARAVDKAQVTIARRKSVPEQLKKLNQSLTIDASGAKSAWNKLRKAAPEAALPEFDALTPSQKRDVASFVTANKDDNARRAEQGLPTGPELSMRDAQNTLKVLKRQGRASDGEGMADEVNASFNPDTMRFPLNAADFEGVADARALLSKFLQVGTEPNLQRLASVLVKSPRLGGVGVRFVERDNMSTLPASVAAKFQEGAKAIAHNTPSGVNLYFRGDLLSEDSVVHEPLHALTVAAVDRSPALQAETVALGDAIQTALDDAAAKNQDLRNLADFWSTYAKGDANEILAYATTSPSFQEILSQYAADGRPLDSVQTPNAPTLWQRLVDWLLTAVGKNPKYRQEFTDALNEYVANTNANGSAGGPITARLERILGQLLTEGDRGGILIADTRAGRTSAATAYTPPSPSALLGIDPNTESRRENRPSTITQLLDGLKEAQKVGLLTAFRTSHADKLAAYESLFNAGTDFNSPEFIVGNNMRAAENLPVLLGSFMQSGAIKKTSQGGWEAARAQGIPSPQEAMQVVQDYATREGLTFDQARSAIGRMMEGAYTEKIAKNPKKGQAQLTLPMMKLDTERNNGKTIYENEAALFRATPEAQQVQDMFSAIRTDLIDKMEASGVLDAATAKDYRDNLEYVSLDRIGQTQKATKVRSGLGAGLGKLPVLEGGTQYPVGDVIDNTLKTMGWMVSQVVRNDAIKGYYRELDIAGVARKIPSPAAKRANEVVMPPAFVNGEPVYYATNSPYFAAAVDSAPPGTGAFFQALNKASRIVRAGVTLLPPFAIKQLVDDMTRSALSGGLQNPFKVAAQTLRNFPRELYFELVGGQSQSSKDLATRGVRGAVDIDLNNPAGAIEKAMGFADPGLFTKVLDKLESAARASDMSARTAIYERTLAETGNKELAVTRAREFINFRRRGSSQFTSTLINTIPFFNAAIQGTDVLYRGLTGKGASSGLTRSRAAAQLFNRGMAIAGASALYALLMSDDEEYQKATVEEKAANVILPGGWKIPVPREYGSLFKLLPEMLVESVTRSGTKDELDTAQAVKKYLQILAVIPPIPLDPTAPGKTISALTPTALRIPIELVTDYNLRQERSITPRGEAGIESGLRSNAQTSALAKAVGEATGASPVKVDYFLNSLFATNAALVTSVVDSVLNPNKLNAPLDRDYGVFGELGPAGKVAKALTLGNVFKRNPEGRQPAEEFYPYADKVLTAKRTYDELARKALTMEDAIKAEEYQKKNIDLLSAYDFVQTSLGQLKRINQDIDTIQRMPDTPEFTREDRTRVYDELVKTRNAIMLDTRPVKNYIDAYAKGEAPAAGVNFRDFNDTDASELPEAQLQRTMGPGGTDDFVQQVQPYAEYAAAQLGVPVDAIIGQWGLETGWGRSVIPGTNNLGNIKDFTGRGAMATDNMTGSRDAYRAYPSLREFTEDYVALIQRRYPAAQNVLDSEEFFEGLKAGGYAEDPNYVTAGSGAARTASRYLGF